MRRSRDKATETQRDSTWDNTPLAKRAFKALFCALFKH